MSFDDKCGIPAYKCDQLVHHYFLINFSETFILAFFGENDKNRQKIAKNTEICQKMAKINRKLA